MLSGIFKQGLIAIALSFAGIDSVAQNNQRLDHLKPIYKRPPRIPFPSDNPYSAEKAQLGKMLFFDQRLSMHFNISCATCHNPSMGWEDGVPFAVGDMNTHLKRHSPTLLNLAWSTSFFWDGRAKSFEEQARSPIEAGDEMNLPLDVAVDRLNKVKGYREQFQRVFGEPINGANILKAIATFQRTLVSGTAPFDRWIDGDEAAISNDAKQGFYLFNTKAQCSSCHVGWNFTDNNFHDIGLDSADIGRGEFSDKTRHMHAFKTPGLRNINQRMPFMHNGSINDLNAVINHYISGGIQRESLSSSMRPVKLTEREIQQLLAFLNTLTGEDKPVSLPILPI